MADQTSFQVMHSLQPLTIWCDGSGKRRAVVCPAVIVIRQTVSDHAGQEVEIDLESHARILYRTIRRTEGWKLYSLDVVYIKDSTAIPGMSLLIDEKRVSHTLLRPPVCMKVDFSCAHFDPLTDYFPGRSHARASRSTTSSWGYIDQTIW